MSKRDALVLSQPALIPMFGGVDKKERVLDREVMTMGRARGCDFCLDANEVSALHCVVYRAADGFRVRDSGSRTGTRINGQSIKNEVLRAGDILQLGPFSFEIRMPKGKHGAVFADTAQVERLQRSRRHLARLALLQRKRAQANYRDGRPPNGLVEKAEELKQKIKHFEDHIHQLEESEQELMEEREILEKERQDFEERCANMERDLALRKEKLDREVQIKTNDLKKSSGIIAAGASLSGDDLQKFESRKKDLDVRELKVKSESERLAKEREALQAEFQEKEQTLLRRKETLEKELHAKAAELKKQVQATKGAVGEDQQMLQTARAELQEWEVQLKEQAKTLQEKEQQLRRDFDKMHFERKKTDDGLAKTQAEEVLKQQQSLWAGLKDELRQWQEGLTRTVTEAVAVKQEPNEDGLKKQLKDLQKEYQKVTNALLERDKAVTVADHSGTLQQIQAALKQLHEDIKKSKAQPAPASTGGGDPALLQALEQENKRLAQIVGETKGLDQENQRLRKALEKVSEIEDENRQLRQVLTELDGQPVGAASASVSAADVEEIKAENEILRRMLTEYEERLASQPGKSDGSDLENQVVELRGENETLRRLLREKEENPMTGNGTVDQLSADIRKRIDEYEKIKSENNMLKTMVEEKDGQIEQLRSGSSMPENMDPDSYEADLNRFRRQLETDREHLRKELEHLRIRNQELDEATREMEMELSRERAEMGRERMRLDRMRDELKSDMERMTRDQGVIQSLAPVQKLREEMNARRQSNANGNGAPNGNGSKWK